MNIIRRMAEIKDMHDIVKFMHSDNYLENDRYPNETEANKLKLGPGQALDECVSLYAAYTGKSKKEASYALENALRQEYLRLMPIKGTNSVNIDLTQKGLHLIARKWRIYPSGKIDESLQAYSESQKFYTGALVGGIFATTLAFIAKLVLTWIRSKI